MDEAEACFYEAPFKHLEENVKQARSDNREAVRVKKWWRMGRPRPALRKALIGLTRYIATVETSKHRVFVWLPVAIAPEHRLVVIPREDDVTFGILSSSIHLLWAFEKKGTLEDRPVYNTTQCFDTFPFPPGLSPDIPASRHSDNPHAEAIADASRKLVAARDEWLNPSSWVEKVPESVEGLPDRIIPRPGKADDLKQRTLTRLYNEMPHWLVTLQARLDSAVAAAYGWTWPLSDSEIKSRLFELNQKIGE